MGMSSSLPLVAVLANPTASSSAAPETLEELVRSLRSFGLDSVVCWRRDEFAEILDRHRDRLQCVVAAGGDGTLNELLNRKPGVPVAVLPLGHENLVARHFGIGRSGERLAQAIVAGRRVRLDLGRACGRYFTLMASAGFDAEVVRRVHARRRGRVNRLSYALQIAGGARAYSFPAIHIEIEETGERLEGAMAFVFNLPRYGMGLPIAPSADPADGRLDVCVFRRPGLLHLLRYTAAVAAGRHRRLQDVLSRRVERLRLWSEAPVPLQADGDPAGFLPATIEVVPAAMELLI
jgi:YegS/Rv2252/BmrU family lipid kinase